VEQTRKISIAVIVIDTHPRENVHFYKPDCLFAVECFSKSVSMVLAIPCRIKIQRPTSRIVSSPVVPINL
jgi:hypothetical protein